MYTVYEIKNNVENKRYVGSTCHYHERMNRHRLELKKGIHHCAPLQEAYNALGTETLEYNILTTFDNEDEAREAEQAIITSEYLSLYNVSKHATCGDLLTYHPDRDAIIERTRKAVKERYSAMSEDERKEVYGHKGENNPMYGKKHTAEARKAMSQNRKRLIGEDNPFYGRKLSEDTKKALSRHAKQRVGDKNPFFGKNHTGATRKAISEANKGKIPVNRKRVSHEGVVYESASKCAKAIGKSAGTITYRVNSSNFPETFFID